jgi:hypothetical protein
LLGSEAALADALAVAPLVLTQLRRGSHPPTIHHALALVHVLRERAAELQLAAESIVEATQTDVARVVSDAYDRAMREPDKERAVESALQALVDICG